MTLKYLIIFSIIFYSSSFSQNEKEIIATTGSSEITVEEFRNRYEFMPHLNYSTEEPDSLKKEFLYSLIAEKLWAMEAGELSYDTLEVFKYSVDNLQRFLIKDELYREEVESKINITDEEILKGLTKVNRILKINIISSKDSSEIFRISEAIKNDVDSITTSAAVFDSILSTRKEYEIQNEPFDLPFGKLQEEDIEEMLFTMVPGTISEPVQTGDGWFIFRVVDEEIDPSIKPATQQAKNIVFNTIKERRAQKLGETFLNKILGGKSVSAGGKILEVIFENLKSVLPEKDTLDSAYELTSTDIQKLMQQINEDILNKEFIRFEENPLTAKDFLYYLFYQKLLFASFKPQTIYEVLNKAVRQFIEDEMIVREGIKRGLHQRESIKNDLKLWKEHHLSQLLIGSYSDSVNVSDEEIQNFYLKMINSPDSLLQVNIIEILTKDLATIEKIFVELEEGKDFRDLALKYTEREWTKKDGGEFGYFPVEEGNEIGRIASEMEIGEIYGPLKVTEGYSLFKLIGKKEMPDSLEKSFEEKKDVLKTRLSIHKLTEMIINKTVNLANKYEVKINENLLNKTELIELNTFTYRLIGFGGRIAAFPITTPLFEWFRKYKSDKSLPW